MNAPDLPTIVLVGGPFTTEDGTQIDSRQEFGLDNTGRVFAESLATSWAWWRAALSVVRPLLREANGTSALLVGPRSVSDLTSSGTLQRTRLRTLLKGEIGDIRTRLIEDTAELAEGEKIIRRSHAKFAASKQPPDAPFYFLVEPAVYPPPAGELGLDLLVGGLDWIPTSMEDFGARSSDLKSFQEALTGPGCRVMVIPDTLGTRATLDTYLDWVAEGRPVRPPMGELALRVEPDYDPSNPDPLGFMKIAVSTALFGVTGILRSGQWEDPSALESARALLEARYDLHLGLWDLADNPTLRSTLLKDTSQIPIPEVAATAPVSAVTRAVTAAQAKADTHRTKLDITNLMSPSLLEAGWEREDNKYGAYLSLPLAERMQRSPFDETPSPIVVLNLSLMKRQTQVAVTTWARSENGFGHLVEAQRKALEPLSPAPLGEISPSVSVVWRDTGGFADDVDWPARAASIATATPEMVAALGEYVVEARHAAIEQYQASGNSQPGS